MEFCDKCGKPVELREKMVLEGELEGVYHLECANELLGIKIE